MKNKIATTGIVSVLQDVASLCGFSAVSSLGAAWNAAQEKKVKSARDILFQEIEAGDLSGIPEDELVSIIHRYFQAAMNGTAKINLSLLARLIKGITQNNETLLSSLYASEFNRYANILADLSYEELQILSALYKFKIQNEEESNMTELQTKVSFHMPDTRNYYSKARDWLSGTRVAFKRGTGNVEMKQGKKIMSSQEFDAITSSLTRTGLVYPATIGKIANNAPKFELSPLFFNIMSLVEFQSIFDDEKQ